MEEKTDAQLDRRLVELRKTIRQKRHNVADLEAILHQDIQRAKETPIWFWVLLILHFIVMLEGWKHSRGARFAINFVMVLWLQRKMYREIYLRMAIMTGLMILCVSWVI